ncbi:MAG: hypothetical protein AUJ49_10695 [Desulfovibrionaceae bacterium CG1_02_65_16]|nr:MAG: hypothetical protein AUJ49_10695 [Desulfovibrionaceae bacterium CG1_02_65_16]
MPFHSDEFSPDAFAERLRQIRKATGLTGASIAQQGRITKQTFSGYLHTGRLPSAAVLANWVFRLGINANWLLTGEGPIMLEAVGPASERIEDPVVRRVAVVVASMREAGAEESQILQSVRAMLEGELAKLEHARSGAAGVPSEIPVIAASNASLPDGFAFGRIASDGQDPTGHAPNGHAPNGLNPNGLSPTGHAPNGLSPNGRAPTGPEGEGCAQPGANFQS